MVALVHLVTTFPRRDQAVEAAREAVERRLAACVQIFDPITSVYRWEGSVREEHEVLCLLKVPDDRLDALVEHIRERHPYDTPELTAVQSSFVDDRYLAWAVEETSAG